MMSMCIAVDGGWWMVDIPRTEMNFRTKKNLIHG